MSTDLMSTFRGYLISSSTITSLVPTSNIGVAWRYIEDKFPCIVLSQMGGTDTGFLGYNKSTPGSKDRRETMDIKVDIYSRTSRKNTLDIAHAIVPIMISGGCKKTSDFENFDDKQLIYIKTQTYHVVEIQQD